MSKSHHFLFLILAIPALLGLQRCTKETAKVTTTPVSYYFPLETGRYITYQLDSTVFLNYGSIREIHSYQVKDIVDAEITDNLGRPSYRIRRMIRDAEGQKPWEDNAAFMVTPLENSIEVVENNLRYIKLVNPVREWYAWKGNAYIEAADQLNYLAYWDYTYANVEQPFTADGLNVASSITVNQEDYSIGDPEAFPNNIAAKIFSREVYGKDIGLIYKDFIYWQYERTHFQENCRVVVPGQSGNTPCPYDIDCDSLAKTMSGYMICDTTYGNFSYDGYGVKLKMIEHN